MRDAAAGPMSTGGPILLFAKPSGDRRTGDRRADPRRALYRRLDPLFAATLVNQIAPPEQASARGYPAKRGVPAGIAFDLEA
jgi:hypothetical protein